MKLIIFFVVALIASLSFFLYGVYLAEMDTSWFNFGGVIAMLFGIIISILLGFVLSIILFFSTHIKDKSFWFARSLFFGFIGVISVILILIILYFAGKFIFFTFDGLPDISKTHSYLEDGSMFLKNIDFSDGNYVLVVSNEDGTFWINDEKVLRNNRINIRAEEGWGSTGFMLLSVFFLSPSLLPKDRGFVLLKDRKAIRSYSVTKKANIFEYGNVLDAARPFDSVVEEIAFYGTKKEIEEKFNFIDLKNDTLVYNLHIPVFDPIEYNYHFEVKFPSIAVPVHFENKDTDPYWKSRPIISNGFDKYIFGEELYARVMKNLGAYSGNLQKGTDQNAHTGSQSQIPLFDTRQEWDDQIRDKDKKLIHVYGYMLEHYGFTFSSNKEFHEQIKQHDFSQYITEEMRNREELVNFVKEKIKKSEPPISFENVGFSGYRDELKTSSYYLERKYNLKYWKKIYHKNKNI